MMWPQFCIDELTFSNLRNERGALVDELEAFVVVLEDLFLTEHRPQLPSAAWMIVSDQHGVEFVTFLYSEVPPFERDILRRLRLVIDRCEHFGSEQPILPTDVEQHGVATNFVSAGLQHVARESSAGRGFFGVIRRADGKLSDDDARLRCGGHAANAFILTASAKIPIVFRRTIVHCADDQTKFFELAPHAFPYLLFHPDLDFREFSDGYGARDAVCEHLQFLNDEFLELGVRAHWDHPTMMGLASVKFSDESASTKANKRIMRQRQVIFSGKAVSCTLHTKLRATTDRIHFHPPLPGIDPKRVLVGLFIDHLDT